MDARRGENIERPEMQEQEVSDEERSLIGDLGNEFDDPDELLVERPDYWMSLARPQPPTRQSLLRHRLAEAWSALRAMAGAGDPMPREARVPEEVWTSLFETALGPIPPAPAAPSSAPADSALGSPSTARARGHRAEGPEPTASASRARPVRFALDGERAERAASTGALQGAPRRDGAEG